ncbi:MAG: hypothetical protein H6R14_2497 [Proteobacteria bacterium]|nr:hypothetical protein [Pseudomonadota bacterium]
MTTNALAQIAADAARGDVLFGTHADIAARVRRAIDDPNCSVDQLSKLISAEPVLSAKVVGVANSAAYNPSGRVIADVRSAVARLGFGAVRTMATAIVVRQLQGMAHSPEHRALSSRLWEHTAHVAALARVIASRVTHQDPEAAFFAGIVHEVGGFYLISRAAEFPALISTELERWHDGDEAILGRIVLRALDVPDQVMAAVESLWDGFLAMPASSLGDTLLLADQLSPVESPLAELTGMSSKGMVADIDLLIGDNTLSNILADSAEEVASLTAELKA